MYDIFLIGGHRTLDYEGALHWIYTTKPTLVNVYYLGKPLCKLAYYSTALLEIVRHHERIVRLPVERP